MRENQTADIELDNGEGNEYDRNDDSGIDQGHDNRDTDSDSRQSTDDTGGQKGLHRRSPRLKDQLRVTYQETQSASDGRRSHKASSNSNSSSRGSTPSQ